MHDDPEIQNKIEELMNIRQDIFKSMIKESYHKEHGSEEEEKQWSMNKEDLREQARSLAYELEKAGVEGSYHPIDRSKAYVKYMDINVDLKGRPSHPYTIAFAAIEGLLKSDMDKLSKSDAPQAIEALQKLQVVQSWFDMSRGCINNLMDILYDKTCTKQQDDSKEDKPTDNDNEV